MEFKHLLECFHSGSAASLRWRVTSEDCQTLRPLCHKFSWKKKKRKKLSPRDEPRSGNDFSPEMKGEQGQWGNKKLRKAII